MTIVAAAAAVCITWKWPTNKLSSQIVNDNFVHTAFFFSLLCMSWEILNQMEFKYIFMYHFYLYFIIV